MVSYGPIKKILKEYRFFVVDQEIVGKSVYKIVSRVVYNSLVDDDAIYFAKQMISLFNIARAFVIDIALTNNGMRVIEINCINTAGFYAIDVQNFCNGNRRYEILNKYRNILRIFMRYYEIISEAKNVYDARHKNYGADHKRKLKPHDDTYDYIDPSDGFFFTYHDGELALHSERNYDYSAEINSIKIPSNIWNTLSGKVEFSNHTITIGKIYVNNVLKQPTLNDIKQIQKSFRELLPYGLELDFIVKGAGKQLPKTVADVLKLKDPTDQILNQKSIVMYHGTSSKCWEIIKKQGLRPGKTNGTYHDLVSGYSEFNVYLATQEKTTEFYGKRQAKKDGSPFYVILAINVPDTAKLLSDDRYVPNFKKSTEKDEDGLYYWLNKTKDELTKDASNQSKLSSSGREAGEFAYRGIILPKFIRLFRVGKL